MVAGATYQSAPELFLEPLGTQGLAPTDLVVAPDGALLLSIGGRKTRGAIYRIDYPAGSPVVYPTNFLFNTTSELETVLTAPQPLDAWSRASWVPTALRLGAVPFSEAVMDGRWPPALRVRAVEVLTELYGGLSADAAALASQANSPLVRGRVAWALGRAPKVNSVPILAGLSRDSDSFVRRVALDALGDLAFMLNPAVMQQAIGPNLAHPEKRIRQAAARLATYLPDPAFKALWTQLGSGAPQARLTAALALLWRTPKNVLNPFAIDAALSVIAQSRSLALREEAVRLLILALGDYRLKEPSVEVYTAYESALPVSPDLAQRLQRVVEPIFPSGDAVLDAEVARLLAMIEDSNPVVAGKVLGRIAEKSSPTSDFHYLTVLSRLKALPPTNSSSRIAHVILALDRKLDGLEKRPKQNWSTRLTELVQALLARDPKLAPALIADPEFAKPAHVALAGLLGPEHFNACAQRFLDAAEKNPRFVWSPQLIDILSVLPYERITPLLRRQWSNVALRDQIVLKLAEHPAVEDRDKFVTGLSSVQSDVVRASMAALLQLPREESGKLTIALLRFLRRSLNQPDQQPARAQAVTLLSFQTGQPFKIQEAGTNPADLQRAYQPVFNWFAQKDSTLLRQLDADDAQDAGRWSLLLKGAPWDRGDRTRGEMIFQERGCQTCHASATPIGPDLAGVAGRLSRADLFDAIIFPSRDVAGPYRTTTFRMRDGQSYTGIVVFESADGVIVQTGTDSTVRLPESDIASRQPSTVSLMPSGLLTGLQPQGLADLYSYLALLGR
jgi:putative heme-binding domain-containing protein